MLEDKIKAFKIAKIEGNLQVLINTCVENLLYNILLNAKYVLEITNRKIIKVGHLRTINYIQKKSIGIVPAKMQNGGFTVLPSEYFGHASASYLETTVIPQSTHAFENLIPGFSRNGLESTFSTGNDIGSLTGGGGLSKNYYMDDNFYEEMLDKIKTKMGVKISSDAQELIRLSIELNIDMLVKETIKTLKLKNSISVKNVKSTLKNKKYMHFTKSINETKKKIK